MRNSPADLKKARDYALMLLKFRALRSEKELACRLKEKKFNKAVVSETIAYLKANDFINDSYFVKGWIAARLNQSLSLNKIKQELEAKGVNSSLINSQVDQAGKFYREEDAAAGLVKARFEILKNIPPQKAKKRVFDYLLRRGFSQEVIEGAMEKL